MVTKLLGLTACLLLTSSFALLAQTDHGDALKLLDQIAKHYANAQSYRIEAIRESRSSSELRSYWQKETLRAEQAPGNRYLYEGRAFTGSGIVVSDGHTEWNLHRSFDQYTKRPPETYGHPFPKAPFASDDGMPERNAFSLRSDLAMVGDSAKSAHFLPAETIAVGDHQVACFVVTIGPEDLQRPFPFARTTQTFWIDRQHTTIVKSLRVTDAARFYGYGRPPVHPVRLHDEDVTVYPVVELDQLIPDTDFAFTPPEDASIVPDFPLPFGVSTAPGRPRALPPAPEMVGKTAPALTLHGVDGSSLQLASLRGHPVLIDVWATWCYPCLSQMPLIDHIFRKTRDAGLVVVGLDDDRDAKTGVEFLKRKGYQWADYKADSRDPVFRPDGIPLVVLVDAEGKIVYYHDGDDDEPGLIAAVKKLGPALATALNDDNSQ
jgi:cytochrome c biogenesis protein CcmG, thiol:disulfide interchange protein DsbE